jgi:hypothetical protein
MTSSVVLNGVPHKKCLVCFDYFPSKQLSNHKRRKHSEESDLKQVDRILAASDRLQESLQNVQCRCGGRYNNTNRLRKQHESSRCHQDFITDPKDRLAFQEQNARDKAHSDLCKAEAVVAAFRTAAAEMELDTDSTYDTDDSRSSNEKRDVRRDKAELSYNFYHNQFIDAFPEQFCIPALETRSEAEVDEMVDRYWLKWEQIVLKLNLTEEQREWYSLPIGGDLSDSADTLATISMMVSQRMDYLKHVQWHYLPFASKVNALPFRVPRSFPQRFTPYS